MVGKLNRPFGVGRTFGFRSFFLGAALPLNWQEHFFLTS
jgi:hypothetical protein